MARGRGNSGRRVQSSCGNTPKRNGSGNGRGNRKTVVVKKKK